MIKGALSEKQIENQVLSWLKFKGIFAFKVKSTGTYDQASGRFRTPSPWYRKGCPDVLVCYSGRMVGLEVKTQTGRLSVHQKLFHQDMEAAGGKTFVVRDVKELSFIFETLDKELK